MGSIPGSGRSPRGGYKQPTTVFLPGESHGQRSLVDYGVAKSRTQLKQLGTHNTWSSGHHLQLPGFALSLTWLKENGGFYRVQKGTVRSLILMMDHLPWDMGHQGRRTDAGRAASDSAMEEPFLPGQSVGNFRDWRSQCEEARRHGLTYLKEMKSKACQTKC